ncbi:hypothetical protein [Pedobacter jamesrossensis]|uniref:Uncharacterized protein n=1 Tax=Pedobacter jamesrossensis TaxID=1908238 RepID=A0ABV8NPM4_9SPHI
MNSDIFKYILICCFALTLLFKASSVLSVFKNSISEIEYSKDSSEKEEKKIEAEYFDNHQFSYQDLKAPILVPVKVLLPLNFFVPAYFPEVLTPPPSSVV